MSLNLHLIQSLRKVQIRDNLCFLYKSHELDVYGRFFSLSELDEGDQEKEQKKRTILNAGKCLLYCKEYPHGRISEMIWTDNQMVELTEEEFKSSILSLSETIN